MLQPFEPLKPALINRLMMLNKKFIVTQTYKCGDVRTNDGSRQKIHLLASDYEELSRARTHCDALKETDKYAAIIHLDLPAHRKKLNELLDPDSPYAVFFAAIKSAKELQKYLDITYHDHIRRWIDKNTAWRLTKHAGFRASLVLIYGILHIELKYAGHMVKIKFEDLERV